MFLKVNIFEYISDMYLKIRRNGHKDLLSIRRDSIKQSRIVQGAVPSCFESKHSAIVTGNLKIFARE